MCGILGYVGSRPAANILIQGLKRLEYRGYDSAGVALLIGNQIQIKKAEGRLENVEKLLNGSTELLKDSTCGIGHTRWATHGKPTTQNAHPHKTGHIVVVHNGIIENYLSIKKDLIARGHRPQSETDSELFGFMVLDEMEKGLNLTEAVRSSFTHLHGQCSVVVMSEREPGTIVGVRNGSPLVAARDPQGGLIVASDAQPLSQYTKEVIFLEHGDMVVGDQKNFQFLELSTGKAVNRKSTLIEWSPEKLDKGGFPHYMLKEIHEQPTVLIDTFNGLIDRTSENPFTLAEQPGLKILNQASELILIACGTSWHAALLGKYWIERWAQIPVSVELASEFRYRDHVLRPGTVIVGVSQSGETADTLAVLREMRKKNFPTLGISNVRGSTISREADAVFYTSAGPEIGVAATKTFTAQMLVMLILGGYLALQRGRRNRAELTKAFEDLIKLPHLLAAGLDEHSEMIRQIKDTIRDLTDPKGFFFIGRGYSFPMALEGALKLKEIAYDYAEGYAAGELKHGPIAMIDKGMVVVVLAPRDSWRDKTVSNLEEVKARGATVVGVGDSNDQDLKALCDHWIPLPVENRSIDVELLPFILAPVVQLLSYHRAVTKGTDVDKPRNLAKSVTVE
jgi:glucosamine--fructose-6-phosphate aminotransferase (isomerizing)